MGDRLAKLCQSCGLCCDGTLFALVPLTAEDAEEVRGLKLPVISRDDGSPALPQPCAALRGATCTVYAQRPVKCRVYTCHLYSAVAEDEVDIHEALQVIDAANEAIADVAAAFGISESGAMPQARRRAAHGGDVSDPARRALDRAERVLDRHFRGRRRG